jgi:hypothetical protein
VVKGSNASLAYCSSGLRPEMLRPTLIIWMSNAGKWTSVPDCVEYKMYYSELTFYNHVMRVKEDVWIEKYLIMILSSIFRTSSRTSLMLEKMMTISPVLISCTIYVRICKN